jgi:hypothetical protein
MYTTKLTMEERLLEADVAISNALGDEIIMECLSFLGYDENRLKTGLELLKMVRKVKVPVKTFTIDGPFGKLGGSALDV